MKKAIGLTALFVSVSLASATPSAAAGAKLFASNCAGCHGAKAQGNAAIKAPNLKDAAGWKYDLFKRALQELKDDKGVALKAPMMKFPQLKDDDMKSLQAYIKSVAK